jgi:hypothetical protein
MVLGVLLAARLAVQAAFFGTVGPRAAGVGGFHFAGSRAMGALEAVGRYAGLLLGTATPSCDYSFLSQSGVRRGVHPFAGLLAASLAVVVVGLCVRKIPARPGNTHLLRARRAAAAALLWTALFLAPFCELVPLGYFAGRFAYLPMMGVASLLFVTIAALGPRWRAAAVVLVALALACGGCAIALRARDWESPRLLWQAETAREPAHAIAWKNCAVYLQGEGKLGEAYEAVRRASALWPGPGEIWLAQGQIAAARRDFAAAREALLRAEERLPGDADVQAVLAAVEMESGNRAAASRRVTRVLRGHPGHPNALALRRMLGSDDSATTR